MKRLLLCCKATLCLALSLKAQFTTPTIDGSVSASEYGGATNNSGFWYITWDATNLYIGLSNSNVGEPAVLYLGDYSGVPVNGGTNATGNTVGQAYDGITYTTLPFRARMVCYVKNDYREYRTNNGTNGWGAATSGFGNYSSNGTFNSGGVREFSIPWSAYPGGKPDNLKFFGYVMYQNEGGGTYYRGTYNATPSASATFNTQQAGTYQTINASGIFYNYALSTATSTTAAPFSRLSRTDINSVSLGSVFNYYDWTITSGATVTCNTSFITVRGNLYVETSSTLANNSGGVLEFVEGARVLRGGTANIAATTVRKTIPAKTQRKSLLLASPVSANLNISGWQRQIHVTGGTPLGTPPSGNCAQVPSGWDQTETGAPSMFSFDNTQTPKYVPVPNPTTVTQMPGTGYRVFVRGDRSGANSCNLLNGTTQNQTAVTLSSTGTLQTQPIDLSLNTGFHLVGNPYAADLDFDNTSWTGSTGVLANNGISRKYWAYDPNLAANNGTNVTWSTYDVSSGSGVAVNMAGNANPNLIAQGQGFFLNRTSGSGTVTNLFSPDYLYLGSARQAGYFRAAQTGDTKAFVRVKLQNAQAQHIDEIVARYITHTDAAGTSVNPYDAESMNEGPEMISTLKAAGTQLSIQSRLWTASLSDTIALNVKGISGTSYILNFSELGNTQEEVFLRDKMLGILTSVKTTASYPFVANGSLTSTGRFELIFRSSATLAARFISVSGERGAGSNAVVKFTAQEDGNVKTFSVERSQDGSRFEVVASLKGSDRAGQFSYVAEDGSINSSVVYYRIKANNSNGTADYSQVIKLSSKAAISMTMSPNPAKDVVTLKAEGLSGKASVRFTDASGRVVLSQPLTITGSGTQQLSVSSLAQGIYQVLVVSEAGETLSTQKLIKQ